MEDVMGMTVSDLSAETVPNIAGAVASLEVISNAPHLTAQARA